jgi:hypothetical protein
MASNYDRLLESISTQEELEKEFGIDRNRMRPVDWGVLIDWNEAQKDKLYRESKFYENFPGFEEENLTEDEKLKEIFGWHKPGPHPDKPRYMSEEEHRVNLDRTWKEKHGYTYTEWSARLESESPLELEKRQKQALAEGATLDELPVDMDPDEYYDWKANYRGEPADDIDYSLDYDFEDF